MQTLAQIGSMVFEGVDEVQGLWKEVFGSGFSQVWNHPKLTQRDILRKALAVLNSKSSRVGHVTLLMREPLSDRLILELSTQSELDRGSPEPPDGFIRNKQENYDSKLRAVYYQLHDKLCGSDHERRTQVSREHRGLTGWVAVTGHYLKINSERAGILLEDLPKERPELREAINRYGLPVWGRHASEILEQSQIDWNKRLLAVPIFSVNREKRVSIGVLRYSCELSGPELNEIDRIFLSSIASLFSAIENLESMKAITSREDRRDLEIANLHATGDIHRFLRFLASSTQSEISSLYIRLNFGDSEILRLVDAHGIDGKIFDLRDQIMDYSQSQSGLTWGLYEEHHGRAIIFESVLDSDSWKGKNTQIFYRKHLSRLGLSEVDKKLDEGRARDVLKDYRIKLMGLSLGYNSKAIGVLKVEFPTCFDSNLVYSDLDRKFLESCGDALTSELSKIQGFIDGSWFNNATEKDTVEFLRLVRQVTAFQLLREGESNVCQERGNEYFEKYKIYLEEQAKHSLFAQDIEDDPYWREIRDQALKTSITTFTKRAIELALGVALGTVLS